MWTERYGVDGTAVWLCDIRSISTGSRNTRVKVTRNAIIAFNILVTAIGKFEMLTGIRLRIACIDGTQLSITTITIEHTAFINGQVFTFGRGVVAFIKGTDIAIIATGIEALRTFNTCPCDISFEEADSDGTVSVFITTPRLGEIGSIAAIVADTFINITGIPIVAVCVGVAASFSTDIFINTGVGAQVACTACARQTVITVSICYAASFCQRMITGSVGADIC